MSDSAMTGASGATGWHARAEGGTTVLTLAGDWTGLDAVGQAELAGRVINRDGLHALSLQVTEPLRWNSSLLVFVSMLRQWAVQRAMTVDETALSSSSRDLLQLLPVQPAAVA
ncbi:MAG TPA: hypothetical protein VN859_01650, partial [Steroidobacteraceae bacterium]|nr:hypothetical protein [Steroidobacteraceae bacterium]